MLGQGPEYSLGYFVSNFLEIKDNCISACRLKHFLQKCYGSATGRRRKS
ncbi:hypothetical protein AM1_4643 [Acaryochloris marina MBIC11017]|uniref:Uncharacterized protein n=1 Tax=Acaryochloris marina (strain MBIC 11017) TaxID=329726 RepID=B0C0C5_ACAM1|nr:hypothetical protein AM1_4643 [Acaryochloris marina MBIC11017]